MWTIGYTEKFCIHKTRSITSKGLTTNASGLNKELTST